MNTGIHMKKEKKNAPLLVFISPLSQGEHLKEPSSSLNVVTVLILPLGLLPPFKAAVELSELKTLSDEGYFL